MKDTIQFILGFLLSLFIIPDYEVNSYIDMIAKLGIYVAYWVFIFATREFIEGFIRGYKRTREYKKMQKQLSNAKGK